MLTVAFLLLHNKSIPIATISLARHRNWLSFDVVLHYVMFCFGVCTDAPVRCVDAVISVWYRVLLFPNALYRYGVLYLSILTTSDFSAELFFQPG